VTSYRRSPGLSAQTDGVVYLSAVTPRWQPVSLDDVGTAAGQGLLLESHHLEVKRELGEGPRVNRELARDLAALATDGGSLLIGVAEETSTSVMTVEPVGLDGLAERVEQVARSIVDPPLAVVATALRDPSDRGRGVLLVQVPASGEAPHMVDGRYYGRGNTTKHTLGDADVLRLHEARRGWERDALELLEQEIARDPVPVLRRQCGHLFLVAQPVRAREDLLVEQLSDPDWAQWLRRLAFAGETDCLNEAVRAAGGPAAPDFGGFSGFARRPGGVAVATFFLAQARPLPEGLFDDPGSRSAEASLELEVYEDVGLRLFCGRASERRIDGGGHESAWLFDAHATALTRRLLAVAAQLSLITGYLGPWSLAAGLTGIRGTRSVMWFQDFYGDGPVCEAEDYRRSVQVSTVELQTTPGRVTDRLLGRLLRTTGSATGVPGSAGRRQGRRKRGLTSTNATADK